MNSGLFVQVDRHQRISTWISIITQMSSYINKWYVDCLDCLNETKLTSTSYTPAELISILFQKPDIFSARVMGVIPGQPLMHSIHTCDDYLNSNCQCVVLCVDGIHFEIFAKNQKLLTDLYDRLNNTKVIELNWIGDDYDGRRDFEV